MMSIILLILSFILDVAAVFLCGAKSPIPMLPIIRVIITAVALIGNALIMYRSDYLIAKQDKLWQVSSICYVVNVAGLAYFMVTLMPLLAKAGL